MKPDMGMNPHIGRKPYKAAVIGCGLRAVDHIHAYDYLEDAQVAACCAPSVVRREPLAARYGLRAYADAAAMNFFRHFRALSVVLARSCSSPPGSVSVPNGREQWAQRRLPGNRENGPPPGRWLKKLWQRGHRKNLGRINKAVNTAIQRKAIT